MHVHIGAVEAVSFALTLIIVGAALRLAAAHLAKSDNPLAQTFGQGLAFIY